MTVPAAPRPRRAFHIRQSAQNELARLVWESRYRYAGITDGGRVLAGAGVGCDFSALPPRGPHAAGPVAHIRLWDAMCATVAARILNRAYTLGVKGCTVFRANAVTGTVLSPAACCARPKDHL